MADLLVADRDIRSREPLPRSLTSIPNLTNKIVRPDSWQYYEAGSFGDVFRCTYMGDDNIKEVAVKVFRFNFFVDNSEQERDEGKVAHTIRQELELWSRFNHRNVVPFLGITYGFGRQGNVSLVSAWMAHGPLHAFLKAHDDELAISHRLQLLLDIVNGLSFLHSLRMVHGSLSSNNVLIDHGYNACLSDFGCAPLIEELPEGLTYLKTFTLRWAAPERFSLDKRQAKHTTKSDIYSFGNMALFVLSGEYPWSEVRDDTAIIIRLSRGLKPDPPHSKPIDDQYWAFIQRCWSSAPERPLAEDVVSSLQQFIATCTPHPPLRELVSSPVPTPSALSRPGNDILDAPTWKEPQQSSTSSTPPPPRIPGRYSSPLSINAAKDMSAPLSALTTARYIQSLQDIEYPEGVRSPNVDLNKGAKDGKFRYDRDFLMQFMQLCKEKPPNLPPLDTLGIEPVDQSTFSLTRGGSGRQRPPTSAMTPTARQNFVGLGISGGFGPKPSAVPSPFSMGQFSTPTSKLTSEERYILSTGARSASVSGGPAALQFGLPPMTAFQGGPSARPTLSKRVRSKRGDRCTDANKISQPQEYLEESGFGEPDALPEPATSLETSASSWVTASTTCKPSAMDTDSPELVDRKVKALLNKLTMEKFDSISDQIVAQVNKSKNKKDGRTLIQVIRLVFEKATEGAALVEMYARLCWKMMETISPEVQDEGIKTSEGKPIAGGQLFRKYLLDYCRESLERSWVAKETTTAAKAFSDKAVNAADSYESNPYFAEYHALQKTKHQSLSLVKFIGELFKLQILTERIIHQFIKKLLGNVEDLEEEEIEGLCQLLKTVGQLLDVPKAKAHMDVYFTRMKELCKSSNVNPRMQFMLQDVIELRNRKWVACEPLVALSSPALEHEDEVPAQMSEADAKKRIDEDVKEFFGVRSLEEADVYFTNLPEGHRFRLVDKLVASALEGKEADAILVSEFFAQAASRGQCSPKVFEEGFVPTAELLDDIAIDAPNAFKFMEMMLKGAGLDRSKKRLTRLVDKLMDRDKLLHLTSCMNAPADAGQDGPPGRSRQKKLKLLPRTRHTLTEETLHPPFEDGSEKNLAAFTHPTLCCLLDVPTPTSNAEGSSFGTPGTVPTPDAALEPVAPFELSANRLVTWATIRKSNAVDIDSPELPDHKVRELLNKLTLEKFDSISDQIIVQVNESKDKDGWTLIQVVRLVFEKATDEAAWSEMYARLCRKMMETISPEVQDDGIRNSEGKPIAGGQLFRKYLLDRCQEDFERGWVAKVSYDWGANEKDHESKLCSDEDYAAQIAKRRGLGLIKFIGELFKLQMLTERIMHECVKKLLGNNENPEEEEIESLCQLLKTVGQLLDVPKARAHMDVYFARMKELCKSLNVSPRMQFMLQDVIELRDRKWVAREVVTVLPSLAPANPSTYVNSKPPASVSSAISPRLPAWPTSSNVTLPSTAPTTSSSTQPPLSHRHQPSNSINISSPPPTPSTTNASSVRALNTNASTFVPTSRAPKAIVIKNEDGMELNLEALKKHSPQPPTVPIPPPSPVTTSRRTASVRIESEESKRKREEQARLEQEKRDAEERAKKEGKGDERRKRKKQARLEQKKNAEERAKKEVLENRS